MLPLTPRSRIEMRDESENELVSSLNSHLFSSLNSHPSSLYEVGGIRTPAVRVKSPLCCRYTTTPSLVVRTVFFAVVHASLVLPVSSNSHREIVREGVEPSFPLYRNGVLNPWTTGLLGIRLKTVEKGSHMLAFLRHEDSRLNDPCGIRTLPHRLERPATSPEVERAVKKCPS